MIDSIELDNYILSEIIPFLPKYKQQNNNYNFRCPVCGDSKKSKTKARGWLYLRPKLRYYCFNCDATLSGIDFLKFVSRKEYKEIMTDYNRQKISLFNSDKDESDDVDIIDVGNNYYSTKMSIYDKLTELNSEQISHLNNRKITSLPFFDKLSLKNYNNFIFIPWIYQNKIVTYQLNNYSGIKNFPKYRFGYGSLDYVYGIDRVDPSFDKIICFEGVYDSLFVKNGVSIGRKFIKDSQVELIKNRFPKHDIVLSFDNDNTGIKATDKIINDNKHDFLFFNWFGETKCKDINEYVIDNDQSIFMDKRFINEKIMTAIETKFWLYKYNKL